MVIKTKQKMILQYIDPGSGSMIFQMLLASFVGLLTFYKKIISFFKILFKVKPKETNNKSDERN